MKSSINVELKPRFDYRYIGSSDFEYRIILAYLESLIRKILSIN